MRICLTSTFEGQSVIEYDGEEKEKKKWGREKRRTMNLLYRQTRSLTYTDTYSTLFFFFFSFCLVVHLFNEMREECISYDRNRRGKINLLFLFSNTYADVFFFLSFWKTEHQRMKSIVEFNIDWLLDNRTRAIIVIGLFHFKE
jgi:hypothetical protein